MLLACFAAHLALSEKVSTRKEIICSFLSKKLGQNTFDKGVASLESVSLKQYQMMMLMKVVWCYTSFSTVFKIYRDGGKVIMKGPVRYIQS